MLQTIYPLFLFVIILVTWFGFKFQKSWLTLFDDKLDFSGRTMLWRFSWSGFLDKPILGWGWFSAWNTPNFFMSASFGGLFQAPPGLTVELWIFYLAAA